MLHFKDEFETQNIRIVRHNIGAFGVNTYFLICKQTRHTAVIDPGGAVPQLLDALKKENAVVDYMLFTHVHIDHIFGAEELKNALPGIKVGFHSNELPMVDEIPGMCTSFGVPVRNVPAMDLDLAKTPEFSVGSIQLRSILTPGHTPGGVCFYIPEDKLALTGDTLFQGSVGRTDFKGGSGFELKKSLEMLLKVLPDDVQILPGHGRYSTMDVERKSNFYLNR